MRRERLKEDAAGPFFFTIPGTVIVILSRIICCGCSRIMFFTIKMVVERLLRMRIFFDAFGKSHGTLFPLVDSGGK